MLGVLDQVQDVFDEYEDQLPLTIRQVFYRLVAAHGYEKTEQAYARLLYYLDRARRARIIPFERVRDDGIRGDGLFARVPERAWSRARGLA